MREIMPDRWKKLKELQQKLGTEVYEKWVILIVKMVDFVLKITFELHFRIQKEN